MENYEIMGKLAALLTLFSNIPYIITIIGRTTSPNRATWLIWTMVGLIVFASNDSLGATSTLWIPGAYVLTSCIIAILSFHYGEGGWNRFDLACIAIAAASLVVWHFTTALYALMMNIFIELIALLPTLKKVYSRPYSENLLAWMIGFSGTVLNLFAVNIWQLEIYLYPVWIFSGSACVNAFIILRRLRMKAINGGSL